MTRTRRVSQPPLHQLPLLPQPVHRDLSPAVSRDAVIAALADLLVEALGDPRSDPRQTHGGGDESEDHA